MKYERVDVTVSARLHLGLLDLDGGLGRKFGSLGLALERPCTRLRLISASKLAASGPDGARALTHLTRAVKHFGLRAGAHLEVREAIPAHVGLGSGTQLALATGIAACRLSGLQVAPRDVARALDRGARSGIGLGAFEHGGVLLDGGRGETDAPPPILCRLPFPEPWRVLLIFDRRGSGLHGAEEVAAFRRLPPFAAETSGHLCRLILMSALPALAEADCDRFGAAITELQKIMGDYFAPAQGGRFASPAVAQVLSWLEAEGVAGIGQSSWGPTGFALLPSREDAQAALAAVRRRWSRDTGLDFDVCRGRNSGATVEVAAAARATAAHS